MDEGEPDVSQQMKQNETPSTPWQMLKGVWGGSDGTAQSFAVFWP